MSFSGEERLTIVEHLEELRRRVIYCVIALVIALVPSAFFANWVFDLLLLPAPANFRPVYTEMTEMLFTYFKVVLMVGATLAFPVFVYQAVCFVGPGLTERERRYLMFVLPAATVFFLGGMAFSYFVLVPFSVKYLLTFSGIADPMIKIGNYISFVSSLLFWVGVAFETPLAMFFAAKIRIIQPRRLASLRKYAIVAAFVIAAIITPTPDPMTQTLVALPLYLLYEVGLLLTRLA